MFKDLKDTIQNAQEIFSLAYYYCLWIFHSLANVFDESRE